MHQSTAESVAAAIPFTAEQIAVLAPLFPVIAQLAQRVLEYRSGPISAQTTQNFEAALVELTRELGRLTLETTFNTLEPDDKDQVPEEIPLGGTRYRCRYKTPHDVDSTFGRLILRRWLYEPREPGERCLFPLQHLLGLVAGRATPFLAYRVGGLVALYTQREALRLLLEENRLKWTHAMLRCVAAAVSVIAQDKRQAAQVKQLILWLREAYRGRGPHEPVLAIGRDGIMVPICGQQKQQEASVATVSVHDRKGKRLGTIYLGWMPEALQETLSEQLTELTQAVLLGWKGQRPRLAYITDGGQTPEGYYHKVLKKMHDPRRPGERLVWQRVLDYYHAAGYISKLAEALFGEGWRASAWARRMRHVLKQAGGLTRLLQSASYHRNEQKLTPERQEAFGKAYNYLWKRRKFMDYATYQAKGMPIGSGVTEAGCKVVVSQRLKLSGMKWEKQGGQTVLDLRVVYLSGVWADAWNSHINQPVNHNLDTYEGCLHPTLAAAA
jgi:hypothetical protein